MAKPNPLEAWIAAKTGHPGQPLVRGQLEQYQLRKLLETLALAATKSRYYRQALQDHNFSSFSSLMDISRLPFTTSDQLRADPLAFVCVSQSEIDRVVTLPTSGTTGPSKRIFFTAEDQELTRDFFQIGMSVMVDPGDHVLVLLPGPLPGSIGALLREGLARMQVETTVFGPVADPLAVLKVMEECRPDCLVGIPQQVLALARYEQAGYGGSLKPLKSILLSTDHVPSVIAEELERFWRCPVYQHYGMTEMGLGGGVDCEVRSGYHLREADLLFEIIDPQSGDPVPQGTAGEIVFTTLTRKGMPLIRYRTGDAGRFLPGPCLCGSPLMRLEHIRRRLSAGVPLPDGSKLWLDELDEALFGLPGLVDFTAEILGGTNSPLLQISAAVVPGSVLRTEDIKERLGSMSGLAELIRSEKVLTQISIRSYDPSMSCGVHKRVLRDHR
jgi:phenylacetate-coenzyme A ligase PaaK-like adenylate-forming protein